LTSQTKSTTGTSVSTAQYLQRYAVFLSTKVYFVFAHFIFSYIFFNKCHGQTYHKRSNESLMTLKRSLT